MKLHWSPRSPFVRKVMVVLHETGQADAVRLVRNPVAMDKPNPAVLADNPLGKIPTLVLDDGRVLFDSRVICEFLDDRHAGPKLFPLDQDARLDALTGQALGDGLLDVAVVWRAWAGDRGRDPLAGEDAYLAAFALKTRTALDALEARAPALAGAALSIGHVAVGCALSYLDFRWDALDWRLGRPRLAAWHRAFEDRPSMTATRIRDDSVADAAR